MPRPNDESWVWEALESLEHAKAMGDVSGLPMKAVLELGRGRVDEAIKLVEPDTPEHQRIMAIVAGLRTARAIEPEQLDSPL